MNIFLKSSLFTFLSFSLANCTPDENLLSKDNSCEEDAEMVITTTKVCGWFPNYDSLSISSKGLNYYNYCMGKESAKEYSITCDEWTSLRSKLDLEAFTNLTINTCNLCADGCDISLSIKSGDQVHRIKFGPDEVPDPLKEFVARIETLRADSKVKVCP